MVEARRQNENYEDGYYDDENYDDDYYDEEGEEEEGEGCSPSADQVCNILNTMLPFLIILSAISFGLLATIDIINLTSDSFQQIFIAIYLYIFACLIILAELRWKDFLLLMPFLLTRRYRGIFVVFVGTLCFSSKYGKSGWLGILIGTIACVFGIGYFVVSFFVENEKEKDLQTAFEESVFGDDEGDVEEDVEAGEGGRGGRGGGRGRGGYGKGGGDEIQYPPQ